MSDDVLGIHNGILHRLVTLAHVSEDERRDLHSALADAAETINETPESRAIRAQHEADDKAAKRAELQAQIDAL